MPQGSALSPLLFLIKVNDLSEGLDSHFDMFAINAIIMELVRHY